MKVTTLYGRVLKLDPSHSYSHSGDSYGEASMEKHLMNMAVNYLIQGSAAEIFKRMLIEINKEVPIEDFVLQIHDEQLLDGPYILPVEELSHLTPLWTPLEISQIVRWQ